MFFQAEVGEVVILARKVVKNGNWTYTVGNLYGVLVHEKKKNCKVYQEQQDFFFKLVFGTLR